MLDKKLKNKIYPAALITTFLFIYIASMLVLMLSNSDLFFGDSGRGVFSTIYVLIFNILFIISAYNYLNSMFKSPGSPPRFWGFYLQDPQDKQKRMCITCNCFKPERTHHCSTCGRCVLVLDHHCPWLNNCVGFFNRKFFMLLITYAFIFCCFNVLMMIYPIGVLASYAFSTHSRYFSLFVSIFGLGFSAVGAYIMYGFVSYHYALVRENKTTIDEMDKKRGNTPTDYNYGPELNYKFVFGNHKICWPIPYDQGMAAPLGDGVVIKMSDYSEGGAQSRRNLEGGEYDNFDARPANNDWDKNPTTDPLNQYNLDTNNYAINAKF